MATTAAFVSLDEYLNTSYEPDMEFVDGALVERNVGTKRHGRLQILVGSYFEKFGESHRIQAFGDTRLRVAVGRHRLPDILVLEPPFQEEQVVTDVPVITVEIKSPEDTFDDIVDKCFEYAALGVRNILVMDPDNKRAWLFEQSSLRALPGTSVQLNLSHGTLEFPFAGMFAALDAK
jgi:Uma2 family endonuclease